MYICIHLYIFICVYTYIYVYKRIYTNMHILRLVITLHCPLHQNLLSESHVSICAYIYMYVHIHIRIYIYICIYVCTHSNMNIYKYMHDLHLAITLKKFSASKPVVRILRLRQNIVSFIGLFCKRDLSFEGAY